MNSSECNLYIKNEFKLALWSEIKVGDIVKVKENEVIPADLILISTNSEDGKCFIETSSLDGEKNLK